MSEIVVTHWDGKFSIPVVSFRQDVLESKRLLEGLGLIARPYEREM